MVYSKTLNLLIRSSTTSTRTFVSRSSSSLVTCRGIHNPSSSDPFPLPLQTHQPSAQNDSSISQDEQLPLEFLPKPLERGDETTETLRARLVYQSRKRGTLETDLLLSTYAKEHLNEMNAEEMREFDKLMDEPDWDIYYWCTNKRQPPERWASSPLLEKLRRHAKNEGKVVRRMPNLT